jgi:hypothetical protein
MKPCPIGCAVGWVLLQLVTLYLTSSVLLCVMEDWVPWKNPIGL